MMNEVIDENDRTTTTKIMVRSKRGNTQSNSKPVNNRKRGGVSFHHVFVRRKEREMTKIRGKENKRNEIG